MPVPGIDMTSKGAVTKYHYITEVEERNDPDTICDLIYSQTKVTLVIDKLLALSAPIRKRRGETTKTKHTSMTVAPKSSDVLMADYEEGTEALALPVGPPGSNRQPR
ncbi:hypothetical protein FRC19_001547 [Serendipita sp. 401]|nr:hypothetical protein FRC19_001547 [Serendipita sp. 401]KAG9055627.1 hypothetical protein FS842_001692 [Serendipita sp. 407]